jgi:hypothetical protein
MDIPETPDEALSQRARDFCRTLNRPLYSFDLATFAKEELDRRQPPLNYSASEIATSLDFEPMHMGCTWNNG